MITLTSSVLMNGPLPWNRVLRFMFFLVNSEKPMLPNLDSLASVWCSQDLITVELNERHHQSRKSCPLFGSDNSHCHYLWSFVGSLGFKDSLSGTNRSLEQYECPGTELERSWVPEPLLQHPLLSLLSFTSPLHSNKDQFGIWSPPSLDLRMKKQMVHWFLGEFGTFQEFTVLVPPEPSPGL